MNKRTQKKKQQQRKRVAKETIDQKTKRNLLKFSMCLCVHSNFVSTVFYCVSRRYGRIRKRDKNPNTEEHEKKLIQMRLGVWIYYTSTIAMYHFDFNYFTSIHERWSAHTLVRACKHRQILHSQITHIGVSSEQFSLTEYQ